MDDLHRSGYVLIQDPDYFCFGCDAVLLSGFARVKKNESALDLGCGTGVIPVLLSAKTDGARFVGLEIQERLADMARRSVAQNGLDGRVEIITGDINDIKNIVKAASFNAVTVNPPYVRRGCGPPNESESKKIARRETLVDLRGVTAAAAWALKRGGRLYMIHVPQRLVEIIKTFAEFNLETKTLRFVQAYADKKPNTVLIEASLHGKAQLTVPPPLVLYKSPGVYTDEAAKIYYG